MCMSGDGGAAARNACAVAIHLARAITDAPVFDDQSIPEMPGLVALEPLTPGRIDPELCDVRS